jgi:hypothetical protein
MILCFSPPEAKLSPGGIPGSDMFRHRLLAKMTDGTGQGFYTGKHLVIGHFQPGIVRYFIGSDTKPLQFFFKVSHHLVFVKNKVCPGKGIGESSKNSALRKFSLLTMAVSLAKFK